MPRFVVLEHDHPFLHWDLLLEDGDAARTWRLLREPFEEALAAGESIEAQPLGDHRLHYLDYEGPVSGGRGTVVRRDAGEFTWLADRGDRLRFHLDGERLTGDIEIVTRDGHWSLQRSVASET